MPRVVLSFRTSVVCSLLALLPLEARTQGIVLAGSVSDSTGRPLSEVLVFVDEGSPSSLTDDLGLYVLSGLSPGEHEIGYRRAGYAPRTLALDLSAGDSLDIDPVVLQPGPDPTATLSGRVTDGEGGSGLAGATIELNGRVVAVSDTLGSFAAPGAPVVWGSNDLVVRHRAFSDRVVSGSIWVSNPRQFFGLVVAMEVEPVGLPEVPVTVQSTKLAAEGFYQRREELGTSATFMTREEIDARNPRRMDDLLRGTSLGRIIRQQDREPERQPPASFGNAQDAEPCRPIFFLDGVRLQLDAPAGVSSGLEQLMTPDEIEGIEIYETVARLPAEFSPIGATCGVVLIWTR